MNTEDIKNCVREVLSERTTVDVDVHREHHLFLEECIPLLRDFLKYRAQRMAELKKREEMWERLRMTALGSITVAVVTAIIGALAWIGTLVTAAFIHWVQTQPPTGG